MGALDQDLITRWNKVDDSFRDSILKALRKEGAWPEELEKWSLQQERSGGFDQSNYELSRAMRLGQLSIDLRGINLENENLSGADFAQTRLQFANLSYCILRHADFQGADLSNARVHHSDLSKANLTETTARFADFSDSRLNDVFAVGADLTAAKCVDATFRGAILRSSYAMSADFRYCDFTEADLSMGDFSDADLTNAELSLARIYMTRMPVAKKTRPVGRLAITVVSAVSGALISSAALGIVSISDLAITVSAALLAGILASVLYNVVDRYAESRNLSEVLTDSSTWLPWHRRQ